MPNTAVMIRCGCTGLFGNAEVTRNLREMVSDLFGAVGAACWVKTEEQLHAVTALSGSGPAYFHLFSEALTEAGVRLGLTRELATRLVAQTALGAASLQCRDGTDFVELRREVTSPNGTTHAAIQVFEKDGSFRKLVTEAVAGAHQRSIELSRN
ncbi:pyrroline-5-carboxylate reductase family protein [Variovorax sp. V213]|uniref:pyrroline-5-carboxylate reductase family protein n=1 Tax=Variovorax sp. V213 TaxID=3065955 RepID=UPI0034E8B5FF